MRRHEDLGEKLALEEKARQILLLAAHVELVEGLKPDMFRDIPAPEFSQAAITRLARHGFPFAGLVRVTPLDDLAPNPTDQIRIELLPKGPEALRARFEAAKAQTKDLLFALVKADESDGPEMPADVPVITEVLPSV